MQVTQLIETIIIFLGCLALTYIILYFVAGDDEAMEKLKDPSPKKDIRSKRDYRYGS